jgi:uncharacterized protein YihD (DUF1040 family)
MRDKKRIPKIIKQLEKIWKEHPELRLGQLIQNCFDDIYYIEDDTLISVIERFYKNAKM